MDPSFQVSMQCQATSGEGWYKSGCVCKVLPSVFWKQDNLSSPRRKWLPWEQAPIVLSDSPGKPFLHTFCFPQWHPSVKPGGHGRLSWLSSLYMDHQSLTTQVALGPGFGTPEG